MRKAVVAAFVVFVILTELVGVVTFVVLERDHYRRIASPELQCPADEVVLHSWLPSLLEDRVEVSGCGRRALILCAAQDAGPCGVHRIDAVR